MASRVTAPVAGGGTFWRRRVIGPVVDQLTLGVTADRLAVTLAVASTTAIFPLLGATTALTLGAGLALRLNQVVLHTVNQLLGPVQLLLILVYVRAGEWLWRAPADHFSVADVVRTFRSSGWSAFLARFGWAGVHAVTAWAASAPFVMLIIYLLVRTPLMRMASVVRSAPAA
ncbi:hypothetical protein BH11GEM2_BH11GEM2_11510 [soil metagenome]